MFESTDNIIKKVVNRKGFAKTAESSRICYEADKALSHIFPRLKSKIDVKSFQNGVLRINSPSGAINQEIHLKEDEFLTEINRRLKENKVKRLSYSLSSNKN